LDGKGAQRDSERIHNYVQRVKGIARKRRNCGTLVSEAEVLDAVLAGLYPRHNMLRTVLENDSTATLALALPRLMKDEQKVWGDGEGEEQALLTFTGGRGRGRGRSRGGLLGGRLSSSSNSSTVSSAHAYASAAGGRGGAESRGKGRGRVVPGWNGVVKPHIESWGCGQLGHFGDKCPQGEGARAYMVGGEEKVEGEELEFAFMLDGGWEDRWEEAIPGMVEDEKVHELEEAYAVGVEGGKRMEMEWVLDSAANALACQWCVRPPI